MWATTVLTLYLILNLTGPYGTIRWCNAPAHWLTTSARSLHWYTRNMILNNFEDARIKGSGRLAILTMSNLWFLKETREKLFCVCLSYENVWTYKRLECWMEQLWIDWMFFFLFTWIAVHVLLSTGFCRSSALAVRNDAKLIENERLSSFSIALTTGDYTKLGSCLF